MALGGSLPQINLGVQGIGKKIEGRREVTDTRTVADRGGSSIDLRVKVLRIIGRFDGRRRGGQSDNRFHNKGGRQGIEFMKGSKLTLDFDQKSLIVPDDQIKQLLKVEKPVEIDLSDTKLGEGQKQKLKDLFNGFKGLFSDQPGLTYVLYHEIDTGNKGPVVSRPYRYDRVIQGIIYYHIEKMLQEGTIPPPIQSYSIPIRVTALRALALNSREQLIREQREDPELGHIYRYLENPDDGSVNATVCENWSQDFKLINGLLFYTKYSTTLGELRVYIPRSLREAIMQEFHDLPLAGHLGKRKTYLKLRDTCYFPYMRKYIFEYLSTCNRCQKFNYKNALPAGRLIPIVSNYPNEIVTLDLLSPYATSRPERYRFLLVITDHFTKESELIPLRKASAQAIANTLFENYISRYGALFL
ncbi:transposon Ty3-I Gag-Pol polyprotein [Trichonephila clavipes]|nr:transposon Ty3-I Gag-Pol polyprotein [Trichonephila clavipes]